jgi:hypothetical protein
VIIWELYHDLDPDNPDSLLRTGFETRQGLVAVAGDFNHDGNVDAEDYAVWAASFGSEGGLPADGNGDGIVDAADYLVWRDAIAAGPARAAVEALILPEPSPLSIVTAFGALSLAAGWLTRN